MLLEVSFVFSADSGVIKSPLVVKKILAINTPLNEIKFFVWEMFQTSQGLLRVKLA